MDFSLSLPDEICAELGARARRRRVLMNISVETLAQRVGVSDQTVSHFERTGKCTLTTFVRILESLNATSDLNDILVQTMPRTIEEMRARYEARTRKRAYRKVSKVSKPKGSP